MTDNTVRPAQTVTRAELAVMIVRYLEYRGITLPDAAEETVFTDDAQIAKWCREQIYVCQRWGIFKGDGDGRFNPSAEATRAEGATIVLRLMESVDSVLENEGIVICREGEESKLRVVYVFGQNGNDSEVSYHLLRIKQEFGMDLIKAPFMPSSIDKYTLQFVFNADGYPEIDEMKKSLGEDSYAVKVVRDGEYTKVLFAYTSTFSGTYAVEYLLTKYVKDGVFAIPYDLDITGTKKAEDFLNVVSSIDKKSRDPFIYAEDGVYTPTLRAGACTRARPCRALGLRSKRLW